ncbi:hypothetical protein WEN_01830 [Mycoplasma wenyonii str. Massachusetts]|uniref:Uncharacterized protein n=1 Tax=Mycoplasma wenyonii (strain Massachusetts) TaxID=1197325 RepID=I6YLI5_MYCWM|nr:hypothetical protein WEN_01830 [Mycoplasma wenyonii str. Massachusetts]
MLTFKEIVGKILNTWLYRPDKNLLIGYQRFLWASPLMCVLNTITVTLYMCHVFPDETGVKKFFGFIGPEAGRSQQSWQRASFAGYTIILLFYVYVNYLLAYKFFKTDYVITGGNQKNTHINKRLERFFLANLAFSSTPLVPFLTTLGIWLEWKKSYANYEVVNIGLSSDEDADEEETTTDEELTDSET